MNSSRKTRNAKNRVTRVSGELDSDESHIVEERLKNLLIHIKEQEQPRNIFKNVQEIPKLRRSVVARAVQNVICSTPMPSEKKRDFFCTENSLNISPIEPVCEGVEINEDKKEQNNECKEAKVILTRASLPIVISDSEDENEEQSNLKEGEHQNVNNNVETRIHYNTRSGSRKNIENSKLQNNENTENIPSNTDCLGGTLKDKSNSKRGNSRNAFFIKKSKKNKPSNVTDSKQIEVGSLDGESTNAPDKHSSLKSIQYKPPKSNSNLIDQNVYTDQNATTPRERENTSFQSSRDNVNKLHMPSNCNENPENDCEQIESPPLSPEKTGTLQDDMNLKKNKTVNEVTDHCVTSIIRTKSQDFSVGKNKSKVLFEQVNSSSTNINNVDEGEKHVDTETYRSPSSTKSTQGTEKRRPISSDNKFPEMVILCENMSNKNTLKESDTRHQRKISPRKLCFTSKDKDKDNENAAAKIHDNQIIPETAKEFSKSSKIPIPRTRSKSRDKNLDSNSKKKNITLLDTEKEKFLEENSIHHKLPPKRPPRKKTLKNKLAITGDISKTTKGLFDDFQRKFEEGRDIDNVDEPLRQLESEGNKDTTNKELPAVSTANKLDHSNFKHVEGKEVLQNESRFETLGNVENEKGEITEKRINPEKTVEIGTSPIIFTPTKNNNATTHFKEVVEAGTSTCNFSKEKDIFTVEDKEKNEKLHQLILKASQGSLILHNKSLSNIGSQKSNIDLLSKSNDLSELLPSCKDKQVRPTMTNKAIQTSGKKTSPVRNKRKTKGLRKKMMFDTDDNSKSSSSTDHSEIIKSLGKSEDSCILFHSLEDYNTFSSSSNDEVLEGNGNNGPWRIDENLQMFSIESCCKLNFLKSAQEIEMQRLSQGLDRNKSDRQLVQMRSKIIQYASKNKSEGMRLHPKISESIRLHPADVDNKSSSPRSVMSDLIITDSDSEHDGQPNKQKRNQSLPTSNNCRSIGIGKNESAHKTNTAPMFRGLVQSTTETVHRDYDVAKESPELPSRVSCSVAKTNDKSVEKQVSRSNHNREELLLDNDNCHSIETDKNKSTNRTSVQRNTEPIYKDDNMANENPELPSRACSVAKTKTNDESVKKQVCKSNNYSREQLLLENDNCQYIGTGKSNSTDKRNTASLLSTALAQCNTETIHKDDNVANESPDLSSGAASSVAKTKTKEENVKKRASRSNLGNSFHCITENVVHSDDDEILAVPLEDTDPPVMEQISVRTKESSLRSLKSDKITNSKAEHQLNTKESRDILKPPQIVLPVRKRGTDTSANKNSADVKPVKVRAQKSKSRKIIPENDDGVSSTTVGSEDVPGLRRSGRERKPTQRRCYGAIATHSERVVEYYNKLSGATNYIADRSSKQSKPRTKKKKKGNNEVVKQSEKKSGKRGRKKKLANDIGPQDLEVQVANEGISDVSHKSNRQADNLGSNQVETHEAAINEAASKTPNCSDVATRRTSKRQPKRNCNSSSGNMSQDEIPKKRNNTLVSRDNEDIQVDIASECGVSPRKNTNKLHRSCDSTSEIANFNTNIDAGATDNITNNNRSNDIEDIVSSQLLAEQNKDSGRSSMMKSITFEDSNLRITKPLTGRISKSYKKKDNMGMKISKVLSRSINTSREHEIVNENFLTEADSFLTANRDVDIRTRRTSIMKLKPVDSEHINLMMNDNIVSLKYVEKNLKFKLVQNNLMVSEGLKNMKDGGSIGHLKLPPGCQKPLHIARKFALFYTVIEGEGFIQVHNKTSRVGKSNTFIIPIGVEYSILNTSRESALVLSFVKVTAQEGH